MHVPQAGNEVLAPPIYDPGARRRGAVFVLSDIDNLASEITTVWSVASLPVSVSITVV